MVFPRVYCSHRVLFNLHSSALAVVNFHLTLHSRLFHLNFLFEFFSFQVFWLCGLFCILCLLLHCIRNKVSRYFALVLFVFSLSHFYGHFTCRLQFLFPLSFFHFCHSERIIQAGFFEASQFPFHLTSFPLSLSLFIEMNEYEFPWREVALQGESLSEISIELWTWELQYLTWA